MPDQKLLNNPWQVWVKYFDRPGWATRLLSDYPSAYKLVAELYKQKDRYSDYCIVSRAILFDEPGHTVTKDNGYTVFLSDFRLCWNRNQYQWCKRCRRPTLFNKYPITHRALKKAPVLSQDDPYRCYYCGARRSFAGG